MREPTEPQASIKANSVGIPHLQEWEEVKIVSAHGKHGKGFMIMETMTDYDGLNMLMHTGADMLMFELNDELNLFRILWILLLIAGFKLTGMFINENMNANHVNIIRNMLIKLSESCQHAANHANTIVPVPVMSVIVA